jgi:hypothetical protein
MLDNHPLLAVANDTHFIPAAVAGERVDANLPINAELVERVRSFRTRSGKGFFRLGLPDAALDEAASRCRTYSELVTELYSRLAEMHGKALAGEKTPDYVRHLSLLHTLFPWAKFVHLIRDGRDVGLALLDWAREGKGPASPSKIGQREPIAACALWWEWQVSSGRRDRALLGSAYQEVRYEDLVGRPEATLRAITDFLELPFAPQMLTYHVGRTRSKAGLQTNKAWLPPTPGVRDWRRQMSPRDLELFEAIAGDLLSALGYERAIMSISPDIGALRDRHRAWWQRKLATRQAASVA